jgi:hypothetical protein
MFRSCAAYTRDAATAYIDRRVNAAAWQVPRLLNPGVTARVQIGGRALNTSRPREPAIDSDGHIVATLQDPGANTIHTLTGVNERDGVLYLGGLAMDRIATLFLPPSLLSRHQAIADMLTATLRSSP